MKITDKLTFFERRASLTGKHLPMLTGLSVTILFLLTMAVVVFTTAVGIRSDMEKALQQEFNETQLELAAVNNMDDVPVETLYSEYQRAMANQSDLDGIPYTFLSGSFLMDADGNVLVESRNCLICMLRDEENNDQSKLVTLAFIPENTSDVGAVLWNGDLVVNHNEPLAWAAITGYWENGLFMTYEIQGSSVKYKSPVEPPDGVALETIRIGANADLYDWCISDEISKNFGADNYAAVNFTSKWAKVDKLMRAYQKAAYYQNNGWYYGSVNNRGNLFSMNSVGFAHITDQNNLFSGGRVQLVYCTRYSPIGLAVKSLILNGTFMILLLLFTFFGCAMVSCTIALRKREIQTLQDEITRQKKALDYAKEAEVSRREMTSAIAHELKTPIAVLSSYAEALQENIDAEKQTYYLDVIREETDRMDRMVLELLDLSRLEAGRYKLRRENFDLEELVREIVRPLEPQIQEKHIQLDWQIGEKEVNADRYRFGQVVENYMTNAIRHTPEGGKIILRLGMNRETFSVENQGRAIPADQLPKVWETFWQGDQSRNKRGSGLGLSICRSIMLLHGGSCRAENTASGVRFTANITAANTLLSVSTMPREDIVELQYPIAQEFTTVERVFLRLRLLDGLGLRREIRARNIHCGQFIIDSLQDRLYPGYVVSWENFRITITVDNRLKQQALLINQFQPHGRLSSNAQNFGSGSTAQK